VTKRYARYALGLIFFANFLSYFDRQIVSVLETDLTGAFRMDKGEFGFLVSAFTLGYMVFAPIVGFMTDRYSRTRIFAVCIFLWSLATIGSGLAGFGHPPSKHFLYSMRFFIGIGEAGCLVIGPTLISDYFSREVRGRALSLFFLALPLGGAAGYIVGGFIAQRLGWERAFYFAGAPGFLVCVLVWILVEPPRGGSEGLGSGTPGEAGTGGVAAAGHGAGGGGKIQGFRPYVDLLRNRTLLFIILAQAFAVIFLAPLLHFGVGFFEKKYHLPKEQAALMLGGIAIVAGSAGNSLSGFIGDRLAAKRRGAYSLMAGFAFALGLPFLLVGFMSHPKIVVLPSLAMGAFCYFLCMPAVNTQIANCVSARQRAMAYGLAVFILHLLGDMSAPPVFGKIATAIGSTQKAFVMFSFTLLPASACCFVAARRAARDEARAGEPSKPAVPNG
jgi:MFS family permease